MRVEIIPADRDTVVEYSVAGANPSNLLLNFNVYDDIAPLESNYQVPNYDTRYIADSFKTLDPNKTHTIYRDNKHIARSENSPWIPANPPNFHNRNPAPRSVTIVGWNVAGSNAT